MTARSVTALHPEDRGAGASPLRMAKVPGQPPGAAYFDTPALRALLEQLLRELPHTGEVLLVRAPPGSGKSTLLQRLLQAAPSEWELTALQARIPVGESHLVGQLNRAWFPEQQLDSAGLAHLMLGRTRNPALLVLAVDDAHRLSPFALRWLLLMKRAVTARGGRLGVVLFAAESIADRLATPSVVEMGLDAVRILDLPPFSLEETADYLRHRLGGGADDEDASSGSSVSAGAGKNGPWDDRRLRALYRASGGRPGAIERLLSTAMQDMGGPLSFLAVSFSSAQGFRRKAGLLSAAALGILLIVAAVVFYFPPPEPAGLPVAPQGAMADPASSGPPASLLQQGPEQIPGHQVADGMSKDVRAPEAVAEQPAARAGSGLAAPVLSSVPSSPGDAASRSSPGRPASTSRTDPAASQGTSGVGTKGGGTKQGESGKVAGGATAAADTGSGRAAVPRVRGSDWIMEQDSRRFTIQLTSWADEKRAIKYIRDHRLYDDAAYVHTRSKGRDWYLVVYRTYPSVGRARQAIKNLPAPLKKYGPWVRNVSSLQSLAVLDGD